MTQQQSRARTRSRSYRCRTNGLPVRDLFRRHMRKHLEVEGEKKRLTISYESLERGGAPSTFCLLFQESGRAEVTAGNSLVCFTASAAGPDSDAEGECLLVNEPYGHRPCWNHVGSQCYKVCLCVIFVYVLVEVFENPHNYAGDRF